MEDVPAAAPKAPRPPLPRGRTRTIRCRKCGDRRELELPPEFDRQAFVQMVCPRCSARALLPTGRLRLLQILGTLAFIGSVAYVVYTITHAQP